ncbi:hypothetical protein CASFOL_003925 [Castilleja foliolosa]|uniref:Uncharacterized protein n=1 Tax=Castilleja foliolosa TaxID=1961234 RepID=A0ABD3EMF4_9LAMI
MEKPNCHAQKDQLKKGPWTRDEDQKLLDYVGLHGHGSWRSLPAKAGLERCGKSCRLRWTNYLRPDIKRGKFSTHEEKTIIRLYALLGNRWSSIAAYIPKRTDNEIKNYWNTRLKKRLTRMGIDPATHKPKNNNPGGSAQSRHAANVSHMAQWETARLEAEARLARSSSKLHKFTTAGPNLPPAPAARVAALPCLDVLRAWQASTGSLDSPTSTLSFSSNGTVAVPTVSSSFMTNGVVSVNNNYYYSNVEEKGKMENLSQVYNDNLACHVEYDSYDVMGAMDLAAADHNSEGCNMTGGDCVGEFEDIKNYWNDILSMVSSPVELPGW